MLAVIEHRTVDDTVSLVGKVLEVLVVGCHHAHHLMVVELFEYGLGYCTANLRLGATAHLIDENKSFFATFSEEQLHVLQMAAIGTQVVLYALLVTDIDENVMEQADVGIVTQGGQQTALHHILHNADSLETHRLATGIGAGNHQDALLLVQRDV